MKTHCVNGHEMVSSNIYWRGKYAKCKICNNARVKKWILNHPAEAKEANRVKSAAWKKRNPTKVSIMNQKRRSLRTQAGGHYTLEEWIDLCSYYGNVCLCCNRPEVLTPDHVIPIALGGTSSIDNIQPLCLPCNLHKYTGTTDFRKLRK